MRGKRIVGIVLILCGIGFLLVSNMIKGRVAEGREEIKSAQKKVDTGSGLFSGNPISEEIGKGITGSMQSKINAGTEEANKYAKIARWLQIGGIVVVIVGVGVFLTRKK